MNDVANHAYHCTSDFDFNKLNHFGQEKTIELTRRYSLLAMATKGRGNGNGISILEDRQHNFTVTKVDQSLAPGTPLRRAKQVLQRFKLPMPSTKKQECRNQVEVPVAAAVLPRPRRMSASHRMCRVSSMKSVLMPQDCLDQILESNGYSIARYDSSSKTSIYRHKAPTAYQTASFHARLLKLIENNDVENLSSLLSAGLSPNPYMPNAGEYLIHYLCRQVKYWKVVKTLLEFGGPRVVQLCDVYGRTPLHIVCMHATSVGPTSSPELATLVTTLLDCDKQLFYVTDCRRALPLSYIRKELYKEWIQFIKANQLAYWPTTDSDEATTAVSTQPTSNPRKARVTIEVVALLASGKMDPDEVHVLQYDKILSHEDEYEDDDEGEDQEEAEVDNVSRTEENSNSCDGSKTSKSYSTLETLLLEEDTSEYSEEELDHSCSFGTDEMAAILETISNNAN